LVSFEDWGQDIWFQEAPVVVRFDESKEIIWLYCDVSSSRNPFGPDGLKKVYPILGSGWGGREAMGGSPRGQKMTLGDAKEAFEKLQEAIG
ncbi:MAG: hypothetical protein Q7K28_02690, partial [Candidatus Wildermuthbacteria bacterium]|nr:hypothetical protein [Candidatus Wildermuthbacteria bacterium]